MKPNESKHALMVAFNYPPSANVGVFRTLRFTRFLPGANWSTSVLTSAVDMNAPINSKLSDLIPIGIDISRVPLVRPEDQLKSYLRSFWNSNSKKNQTDLTPQKVSNNIPQKLNKKQPNWRNALTELMFAIPDNKIGWKHNAVKAGLDLVSRKKTDVIFATAPPFSTLLVGYEIARRANLPLVLDFRDPWTRVPWGPRNKSWFANRIVEKLERKCVLAADAVILNTPQLEADFVSHYKNLPRQKFTTIPNGFDPAIRAQVESLRRPALQKSRNGKPFRILHPGSLYRNRDPRPIIDAIAELKRRGISIVFEQMGYCEPSFELTRYAKERDVAECLDLKPPISHDQLLERMAEVDAFLILQPGTALQVPGKLFEMILYKKPIVAICVDGAVSQLVKKYEIGMTAEAGDVTSIADAFEQVHKKQAHVGRWAEILKDFDGRQLSSQLAVVFERVVEKRSVNR